MEDNNKNNNHKKKNENNQQANKKKVEKPEHKIGDVNSEGKVWICTMYITNRHTGQRIRRPNGRPFCFWANPRSKKK